MNIAQTLALVNEERQLLRNIRSILSDNRWSTDISEEDQSTIDSMNDRVNQIRDILENN